MAQATLAKTRPEARECGDTHYFTGKPCKRGHVARRPVRSAACVECSVEDSKEYREKYGDRHRAHSRAWHYKNVEASRAKAEAWRVANMSRAREQRRKWKRANRAYCAFDCRRTQAAKLQRTPAWADQKEIRYFYEVAAEMSAKTGELWTVDHEIPLQGKLVSGLHVHQNLQLMLGKENFRKRNHFIV